MANIQRTISRYDLAALLHVDFHDQASRERFFSAADISAADAELLKTAQRLARLVPLTDPVIRAAGHAPERSVARMVASGLSSAHHIAEIPESVFVAEHADVFDGDQRLTRDVHRRAVQVRAAVRHAAANVRDLASPYFRAVHGTAVDGALADYTENMPGYQELFGGLNYVGCDECGSIFGPAAYFFDLMRITDRYITRECPGIPPRYTLRERRPDLFDLPLTCENTNTPIPYVVLVDKVLERTLGAGVVRETATSVFPFTLPYNEPRTKLTNTLARLGTHLAAGAATLLARDPDQLVLESTPLATAALGLSPELVRFVTTVRTTDAEIAAGYGLPGLAEHLPAPGPGALTVRAGSTAATGADGRLGAVLEKGRQFGVTVAGRLQIRTVVRIVSTAEVEVDVAWTEDAMESPYTIYPAQDLTTVRMFRDRAGISAYDDLTAVFEQRLSAAERGSAGPSLWINASGESLPDLAVSSDIGGDQANPVWRVVGLSAKRLDRLGRLLRLSRAVGVPVDVVDWLIVMGGPDPAGAEITDEFLVRLATLVRLAEAVGLKPVNAAAFAYPLKTIGQESATALADPFDEIFNAPSVRGGADPYTAASPLPFDPRRPLAWPVGAGDDWSANQGSVVAASGMTVTLARDASSDTGAYAGLIIKIISGPGAGQQAVVRSYDGSSRLATLYTAWSTVPDASSTYLVEALPGVADRLSAALRVRVADLHLLGAHVGGSPDAIVLLTLENLTSLWRLATLTGFTRLTTDAFLTLARILRLPVAPSTPAAGLEHLETVVTVSAWLARTRFTVYELDYVLNGVRGRYLRLGYDPGALPANVTAIARNGSGTLLTVPTLVAAGFPVVDADQIHEDLRAGGFVDAAGVVLPARGRFAAEAARFPIPTRSFISGGIDSDQARAAVAELREQHPPYLTAVDADTSELAWDYAPGSALPGLFTGIGGTEAKRAIVSGVLDDAARRVSFAELAGLAPVPAGAFVSEDIGPAQSRAVYDALVALRPPVLVPAEGAGVAMLSAEYTPRTPLPGLFVSPATGQQATVAAYTGATRVARIQGTWSVVPDAFATYEVREPVVAGESGYRVERVVARGSVCGGTSDTVVLEPSALPDDGVYDGCAVALIADADVTRKVAEVRDSLAATATRVDTLREVLTQARAAQTAYAGQALASILALPPARLTLLLPLATGRFTLDEYLAGLLTPPPPGTVPAGVAALADDLTRTGLAAGRVGLDGDALAGLARRPDLFGLDALAIRTLGTLRLLSAVPTFVDQVGTDTASLVSYLDVWTSVAGPAGKRTALASLTGWDPRQVEVIGGYLEDAGVGWAGIARLPGLARLRQPLVAMDALSANADFLVRVARIAQLPSVDGGAGDDAVWAEYSAAAAAARALLPARFGPQAAPAIADELARGLATATRDALVGYAIVVLGKDVPEIRSAADLFDYLLIDVETSGCDTTSWIAQGIASIQLYLQRVHLGLEPGASAEAIRETWWDWISTYRGWEANRRVFVYPENYLDPSLRHGASPEFETLTEQLPRGRLTRELVAQSLTDYFDRFEDVAALVPVGAYKLDDEHKEGGQIDQRSVLVARTNTTPYVYYVRGFTRSLFPDAKRAAAAGESIVWEPWRKVEATIGSPDVTPVVAFDRLFLFWNEIEPTKSSKVSATGRDISSDTQSIWTATLRYTFRGSTGTWISSQELEQPLAIRAMPNPYPPVSDALIARAYSERQAYWSRPFAQQIPRGLPAVGTLSFVKGLNAATGTGTDLARQVKEGDSIWVGGERRGVLGVTASSQQLLVDQPFTVDGRHAPFKVIPNDPHLTTFPPFEGPGKIGLTRGYPQVAGDSDTRFDRDFTVGDGIQAGGETRTVVSIFTARSLIVDRAWSVSSDREGTGQITIFPNINNVSGERTSFTTQISAGDEIVADGQRRTVVEVSSDTQLLVTQPFAVSAPKSVRYRIGATIEYNAIPRTRGDERLMVFYGPNLDVADALPQPTDNGYQANPGDDPYRASLNQFNAGLFSSLELVKVIKNTMGPVTGDVTGQPTLLLDQALNQRTVRLFAPSAQTTVTAATPPVRAVLDRENTVLFVREEQRPLIALYWGNSTPGASQNQSSIGRPGDRPLAYHVGGSDSSLYGYGNQIGWYLFNDAGQSFWVARDDPRAGTVAPSTFVRQFWQPSANSDMLVDFGPYTTTDTPLAEATYRFTRLTTSVAPALKARLLVGGFDLLLSLDSQVLPEPPFDRFYQLPGGTPPPAVDAGHLPPPLMDFDGACGTYFWEIFFHAPLLVAGQLTANQDFAEAKRWYEYIYNPQEPPSGADPGQTRFWRFRPFREGMTLPGLREILRNQGEITTYNDDPFNPDAIARLRISAYAKTTVLKYIDNLIRWGDSLFRQDTRESVAQATNLYTLASQLLGRRPERVGTLPPRAPRSFDDIAKRYPDGIPQFLIELENSSLIPASGEGGRYSDVPINDINAYFCVPENSELTGYWDRIEDRLYKIRHCLNIDGVERVLALFAPAIDVRGLLATYGAAGTAGGVDALAGGPVPPFRFAQLIASARNLTEDVIRLGSSLLFALEQQDAQALATLQMTQEGRILDLAGAIRRQQLDLVEQQRVAIQAARDSAAHRSGHYQDLIASGYNGAEIAQIAYLMSGMVSQGAATIIKTASALGFGAPNVGSPFAMTYGGQQVGHGLMQAAAALDSFTWLASVGAEVLGLSGQYSRRSEDWELQKNLADFDVTQFDAQLLANATEKAIARNELDLATTQARQNAVVRDFYRTKFTNEALYGWMTGRLSATYFQTYSLALEVARMAQRALRYELRTDATFVDAGGWDDLRRGLTAGESLLLALDQLESAYLTGTGRVQEITKTISLAGIDPVAFLQFLRTGEATFSFDEALFDADFPGHYRRRIKTLSVSIPALVGPYQNVCATLTQTANRVVLHPDPRAVRFLLGEDVAVDANKIEHNVRAYQSISVSMAQGDSGLFQIALDDPLLLPFEQTGAVSNWRLSMPPANNPIDLSAVADVVFELKYTALDGGQGFRDEVASLPQLRRRKWSSTTRAARQDAGAWHLFMTGPVADAEQALSLRLAGLAPPNTTLPRVTGFFLRLVVADGTTTTSRNRYLTLTLGQAPPFVFSPGPGGSVLAAFDTPAPLGTGPLPVHVGFDLSAGHTPAALLKDGRLSPTVLEDIELVVFLTGDV